MSISSRDRLILGGLILLAVGLPVVLGATSGAITIPHNDDFAFRRAALGLYRDGRIELIGYSVMSLVGQLVAVQPFLWITGGGPWAFALATAGFTVVGIVAGYWLVRRLLSPGRAAVAMLTFVVFPGFLVNTTSFMTDVPELATGVLCLALGARAIDAGGRTRWGWLAASLATGVFAFSIREVAVAAPIAVLISVAAAGGRGRRGPTLVAAIALLLAIVTIHLWTAGLPGQGSAVVDPTGGVRRLTLAFSTLALVLVPAMVLAIASWRDRWRRRDVVAGIVVGLLLSWRALTALVQTGHVPGMLIGNLFGLTGASGSGALAGSRPPIYPNEVWTGVQAVALVATIVLPGVCAGIVGSVLHSGEISRARVRAWAGSTPGMLILFGLGSGLGLVAYGYEFTMFDRYLWTPSFVVAALLLIRPGLVGPLAEPDASPDPSASPEPAPAPISAVATRLLPGVLAAALLSGFAIMSMLELLNSNAFSAARWQMGLEATARGIPAGSIDAGMEWVGYFSAGNWDPKGHLQPGAMQYTRRWPSFRLCAMVSSSVIPNQPGFEMIAEDLTAYRQFQVAGRELPLRLYKISNEGCP